jgi:hypothetical protein
LRVQTAIVTIGLCVPLLTASAAGNVSESALRAATTSVEQVAINGRESSNVPSAAALMLLNERVAFVARARDDSPSNLRSSAMTSVAANDPSSEPHPVMMLLSVAALMAYVIGRRGIQRG